jgi:hypothetical protein
MSTLFLFGAGASHWNPDAHPFPPPPGFKLFSALQQQGGVASTIDAQLAELFEQDFEQGMARFYVERPLDVPAMMREMARYFVQFVPGPRNYYSQLVDQVALSGAPVVFATTNYDMLIEHSIARRGLGVRYHELPVPTNRLSVLKIHGSCNFLPDYQGAQFDNVSGLFTEGSAILETPITPVTSEAEVLEFVHTDNSFAPAMAMYIRGKHVLHCPSYVMNQQQHFHAACEAAERIIVIGLRVTEADTHIWDTLARSPAWLGYVGPDSAEFLNWGAKIGRSKFAHYADTFAEALPRLKAML